MPSDLPEELAHEQRGMPLGDHLEELRRRIVLALVGVVVASCFTLFFGRSIVAWLCTPLARAQREANLPAQTYFFHPTEGFTVYLKVSVIAGLVVASPWVVYQLWRFVADGLYKEERLAARWLTPFSAAMTGLAVLFGYYVMLPVSLVFLIGFSTGYPPAGTGEGTVIDGASSAVTQWMGLKEAKDRPEPAPRKRPAEPTEIEIRRRDPKSPADGRMWLKVPEGELRIMLRGNERRVPLASSSLVSPLISAAEYVTFVAVVGLGLVVAFQLPVFLVVTGWTGVFDPDRVAAARRYCVFGCFALAAVLTPAEPLSMILLAAPLWGLFELGLLLMRWVHPGEEPPPEDGEGPMGP